MIAIDGGEYRILRLLGKGKGGYSYLAGGPQGQVVVKQIHHEPCSYYQFGDKLAAELHDYERRAFLCRACWLWTGRRNGW